MVSTDTSAAPPFPLSGSVAFAGSRHGSPFPVAPVVHAVLSTGGSVRVGSSLAVREALRSGLPVWCAGRRPSVPVSWSPLRLAGMSGWVY